MVPHLDEIPSPVVKALRLAMGRGHTLVGVDANTALVDTGDGHRVIGQRVMIGNSTGRVEYGDGPLPDGVLSG